MQVVIRLIVALAEILGGVIAVSLIVSIPWLIAAAAKKRQKTPKQLTQLAKCKAAAATVSAVTEGVAAIVIGIPLLLVLWALPFVALWFAFIEVLSLIVR